MDDEQDKSGEVGKAVDDEQGNDVAAIAAPDADDEQRESLAVAVVAYVVASAAPRLEHAK